MHHYRQLISGFISGSEAHGYKMKYNTHAHTVDEDAAKNYHRDQKDVDSRVDASHSAVYTISSQVTETRRRRTGF